MNSIMAYREWGLMTHYIIVGIGVLSALAAVFYRGYGKAQARTVVMASMLALLMIFLIGCFPIPWYSLSDRDIYAYGFMDLAELNSLSEVKAYRDPFFGTISYLLTRFLSTEQVFVAYAAIYVGNFMIAARRMTKGNVYWLLVGYVLSMSFVSYGVNTMRAGIASSFVILGLSYYKSMPRMCICLAIATGIHFSMSIPVSMIILSRYYDRTKLYYYVWLLCIPVSLVAGNYFNGLFATLTSDNRTEYLTGATFGAYKVGFRVDFILYSFAAIAVGYYYIFRRKFTDRLYSNIYNAYVLTNAFWILVIRANFTDRFAYLSWFMMPVVLLYPLLTDSRVVKSPATWVAAILAGETIFRLIV